MEQQLALLIALQSLDLKIREAETIKATIPQSLEESRKIVAQHQELLREKEKRVEGLKKERKWKETEVDTEELHLQKAEGKLLSIKTNKEYTAMLEEIEGIKKRIARLEDEVLVLMESIEEEEEALRNAAALFKQKEAEYRVLEQEKAAELAEIDRLLEAHRIRRRELIEPLDKSILERYQRIGENRQGRAVVPIKDDICQGCFLSLPPQLSHEIRKYERIITCMHCQRILYWPRETEEKVVAQRGGGNH